MTKMNTHQVRAKGRGKRGKGRARKKRLVKRCPQSGGGHSRKRTRQQGGGFDIQKWISKLGVEFHWLGYQYTGAGTKL